MTAITPFDPVSADRIAPVRTVTAVSAAKTAGEENPSKNAGLSDSGNAGLLDYARANARITQIMSELRQAAPTASALSQGQGQIESLLRLPAVIIPIPPASVDMVEQAVQLAKQMALRADLAYSAQAHAAPATVDHLLSNRV